MSYSRATTPCQPVDHDPLKPLFLPLTTLQGVGPSSVTLIGGTHVDHSPCFHFLDITWRKWMALLGLTIRLRMLHPGFYQRGGGMSVGPACNVPTKLTPTYGARLRAVSS